MSNSVLHSSSSGYCTVHPIVDATPYSRKFVWVQIFVNLPKICSTKVFTIFNFATRVTTYDHTPILHCKCMTTTGELSMHFSVEAMVCALQ